MRMMEEKEISGQTSWSTKEKMENSATVLGSVGNRRVSTGQNKMEEDHCKFSAKNGRGWTINNRKKVS